jgi:hypothetical protein
VPNIYIILVNFSICQAYVIHVFTLRLVVINKAFISSFSIKFMFIQTQKNSLHNFLRLNILFIKYSEKKRKEMSMHPINKIFELHKFKYVCHREKKYHKKKMEDEIKKKMNPFVNKLVVFFHVVLM